LAETKGAMVSQEETDRIQQQHEGELQTESNELDASELRYRQLVNAVVDYAIFQLDSEGNVTSWNPGARRIKGYSEDEILGKHFSSFYTDEDRAAGVPAAALKQAAETGRFEAEGRRVRKDGTTFWASVVIDRIQDTSGKLIGFAKVTRDVTERVEAQRRLRETEEQLAAAQKLEAVGQLSGGIAHDFNNLLMIVLGNLETIQKHVRQGSLEPALLRAVNNSIRGAQRASTLTNRLLAFSRRQALNPKPLNVNRFLAGLQDFLQRTIGEQVEIEIVGGAGLWEVEVDVAHLESAIVNLAINSRDAMPQGGKLTIEGANIFVDEIYHRKNPDIAPGQYVLVSVSDTGEGMPPETVAHAFEPFFTTKELGRGTGLGLSQVYGFVKQSGGNVKIYSEVGQGTTVKMYFPRYFGKGIEQEEVDEGLDSGAETILVVEDDEDLRVYLSDILRSLDYRLMVAVDGNKALEMISSEQQRIDLLLTDIVMPGMSGRQLADEARRLLPDLKVLYMTGYSRNAVVHQGRLDEGVDLLQKPVSQAELAHRIRMVLDRPKGSKKR
jgi:PAS domain S-box-containing protein